MIPTYRAKSKEQKNTYFEGLLIGVDEETGLCTIRTKDDYIGGELCYLDTLSIHFPYMISSQGNKIFTSLQEDGKGGDIFQSLHFIEPIDKKHYLYHIAKWSKNYNSFLLCNKGNLLSNDIGDGNVFYWSYLINVEYEIVGIQQ